MNYQKQSKYHNIDHVITILTDLQEKYCDKDYLENIDINIDKDFLENTDINIDIDKDILGKKDNFSADFGLFSCFF